MPLRAIPQPRNYGKALLSLLASPTIANKAFVFEQYDHMVRTNTVVLPGCADAAVLRIKGTDRLLAATIDGNGTYCSLDPSEGGRLAVAEAARNLVCVGATPLAVTDCLNFGNPEDPQIMWQFKECVRGIAEACRVLGTPVTGGNVSFYNESPRGAIDPTPVIGMIGLIDGAGGRRRGAREIPRPVTASFKDEGDIILLLGETKEELGASEYLKLVHRRKQGKPPRVNLQKERTLQRAILEAIALGFIKSAHDCSEGGLAVALAECCIMDEEHLVGAAVQFEVRSSKFEVRTDSLLFGESASRIIVTCESFHQNPLEALLRKRKVPYSVLGKAGGRRLTIPPSIDLSVDELNWAWRRAFRHTGMS